MVCIAIGDPSAPLVQLIKRSASLDVYEIFSPPIKMVHDEGNLAVFA